MLHKNNDKLEHQGLEDTNMEAEQWTNMETEQWTAMKSS